VIEWFEEEKRIVNGDDNNVNSVEETYGEMKDWNIRDVTDLTDMFHVTDTKNQDSIEELFNEDISGWDTRKVTTVRNCFRNCVAFNADVSKWNVDKVHTMISAFNGAESFNGNISVWNTEKVEKFQQMFETAKAFNINVAVWNTSRNTNLGNMFIDTFEFNFDLSGWNVDKVTKMSYMFMGAKAFNQNLCKWGKSIKLKSMKKKNMEFMFDRSNCETTKDPKCQGNKCPQSQTFCHKC